MFTNLWLVFLLLCVANLPIGYSAATKERSPANDNPKSGRTTLFLDAARRRCPLCDSSVYSYCSEKLFHDSCCCNNPHNPYYPLPHQCQFADCSFLHANSCQEHKLITSCCCVKHLNMFHKK